MVSVAKPAFFAEYASFYKITCRSRASLTPYHDTKTQISSVFGPNDAIAPLGTAQSYAETVKYQGMPIMYDDRTPAGLEKASGLAPSTVWR